MTPVLEEGEGEGERPTLYLPPLTLFVGNHLSVRRSSLPAPLAFSFQSRTPLAGCKQFRSLICSTLVSLFMMICVKLDGLVLNEATQFSPQGGGKYQVARDIKHIVSLNLPKLWRTRSSSHLVWDITVNNTTHHRH